MSKAKCTNAQLKEMAETGLGVTEIARRVGLTKGAVSQRLKAMGIEMSLEVVAERQLERGSQDFTPIEQILQINKQARAILKKLEGCVSGEKIDQAEAVLALKAMKEIRGQIKLQLDLAEAFLNYQAEMHFRKQVLEIMSDASPEIRAEIIRRFKSERQMESIFKFH
ncbi:MAG: hypothetical protein ABSA04_07670 [Desulfobaccales bacterium]|jgi:predicted transcriptional regulator